MKQHTKGHNQYRQGTPLPFSESCTNLGKNTKYEFTLKPVTPAPSSMQQYLHLKHTFMRPVRKLVTKQNASVYQQLSAAYHQTKHIYKLRAC